MTPPPDIKSIKTTTNQKCNCADQTDPSDRTDQSDKRKDNAQSAKSFSVAMPRGSHPFPSRTRKLSPSAPMVLPGELGGRVGHRRDFKQSLEGSPLRLFFVCGNFTKQFSLRSGFQVSDPRPEGNQYERSWPSRSGCNLAKGKCATLAATFCRCPGATRLMTAAAPVPRGLGHGSGCCLR